MNYKTKKLWIPDLSTMTCRNSNNRITVIFTKNGESFKGQIRSLPVKLLNEWASKNNGHMFLQKVILDAEYAFKKAYAENPGLAANTTSTI